MTLAEHRAHFSRHLGLLLVWAARELPHVELVVDEVKRTVEQQRLYVESGASKTMSSDHLEARAVDFNVYRVGEDGKLSPVWAKEYFEPVAEYWVALDPEHNYWGFAEWGFDARHFGRRRTARVLERGLTA